MSGFGVANYDVGSGGGSNRFKKQFFMKWGSQTYRILPPFGSQRFDGVWQVYHRVHWGAGIIDEKGKFRHRPFLCVREYDWTTKSVVVACPACEQIDARREQYDALSVKYKEEGLDPQQIREKLKPLSEWLRTYNVNGSWYMNVMNSEGEVGILGITGTLRGHLREVMDELRADGYDPTSLDRGFWFILSRTKDEQTGKALFGAAVKTVEVDLDGEIATIKRPTALSKEQIERAKRDCRDLVEEPPAQRLSIDQIRSIVQSGYDSEVVAAVTMAARKEESAKRYSNGASRGPTMQAPVEDFSGFGEEESAFEVDAARKSAPDSVAASVVEEEVVDEAEALRRQIAALEARLASQSAAPAKAPAPVVEPAVEAPAPSKVESATVSKPATETPSADDLLSLSPEDFMAFMSKIKPKTGGGGDCPEDDDIPF